jgi:hypothetical protein
VGGSSSPFPGASNTGDGGIGRNGPGPVSGSGGGSGIVAIRYPI